MAQQSFEVRSARYRLRKGVSLLSRAAPLFALVMACRYFWPEASEEFPLAAGCAVALVAGSLFAGLGLMWIVAALFDLAELGLDKFRNRKIQGGGVGRFRMQWHQFALRDLLAFMFIASLVFAAARFAAPLFSSASSSEATNNLFFLALFGGLVILLGAHVIRGAAT